MSESRSTPRTDETRASTLSTWLQQHRRSVLFLLALLAAGGILAAFKLPVGLFPNVSFPRVVVAVDAGVRPTREMVLQVTQPLEEAIRRVPGVVTLRSKTSRGATDIDVTFHWGTDMNLAAVQVNEAANQVLPQLPPGTSIRSKRMDPTVDPIIAYSLTSSSLNPVQLYDLAQFQLRPLLSSVDGVGRVQVQGGQQEEYHVIVDPAKLQTLGLSMGDVERALAQGNQVHAVGRLQDRYKLLLALADSRLHDARQIGALVLKATPSGVVRLGDVATVSRSVVPQWTTVTADGKPAVLLNIYQQPGGNSVKIAGEVRQLLSTYKLPPGVKLANWYDQSTLVVDSAASVRDAILIGVVLAGLVLLLFLRSLKITLIAMITVPAVLAATVVLLYALGMSFNIMTLGGMAAAVGLVIDDAIVMSEHIVRRLGEGRRGANDGADQHGGVMHAAMEFFRPLAGSSASTVVIFVPLAFLSGVTGAFFKALALTMAAALVISFFVSWLAVPLLADKLLTPRDIAREHAREHGRVLAALQRGYARLLPRLLRQPLLVLPGLAPLLLAGWLAYHAVGSGFLPSMDEGGFVLDYRTPSGTSLAETDRLLAQVEHILATTPQVQTWSRRTGLQLGGGITHANEGDFFVRLKPPPREPIWQVMDQVRSRIEAEVPGINIDTAQLMQDLIGDLTAVPQPVEIKIFDDNPAQLAALAHKTAAAIAKVPGIVEVRSGIRVAGDALDIQLDPTRMALLGVDAQQVQGQLAALIGGRVSTQIEQGPKMVGVRVWDSPSLRQTPQDIARLPLRAPSGRVFQLGEVARIDVLTGQPEIIRENLKRMAAVTARISGADLGGTVAAVKRVIDAPGFYPAGVYIQLGGLYKQQQIAFKGLLQVLAAAVLLVFLLLLFLYERFKVALAILAMPLLALPAVFVGLWVAGLELNISAMMGMTMIVGIVTEVAIFYFSEVQELLRADPALPLPSALAQAGVNRLRPIAMTTLAAILTLLPLAFAIGQGSAMQQPLAVAIIAGLAVQLPLVLLVMPVLFVLLRGSLAQDNTVSKATGIDDAHPAG
ncbi:efflux RND transporter permease subunit [Thiomonas bhubaneswarensis]|uniref:Multidrug efflux pump subunit AcrB n=1 Tax=Thiomonas bhubaneswarensis TaxID=339866 RepID=A0A0K6HYT1_9BURK|nr:efflux RND transporter permease subunit [Thiomonas bhubaneswarensis]CUA96172.1 Multidrug efflux pump subunit AcrB [Thiomonas bhubaneswarensis]